jgi:mRNA-degrading endonuclease RelE of RelBE toxin-antitoxin system
MASGWSIEFRPVAYKELRQLGDKEKVDAIRAIQDLAEDPFPEGSVELRGLPNVYRIRCCGDAYRIVYRVSGKQRKVVGL